MAKGNDTTITTKFTADVSQFQRGIKEANNSIKQANAEFKNATVTMDKTADSADLYGATVKKLTTVLSAEEKKLNELKNQQKAIDSQYSKNEKTLSQLKSKYDQIVQSLGKNSEEAQELKKEIDRVTEAQLKNRDASDKLTLKILNQDTAFKKVQKQLQDTERDLDQFGEESKATGKSIEQLKSEADKSEKSIKDLGNAADDSSDGFTVMKGAIANVIAQGFTKLSEMAITTAKNVVKFSNDFQSASNKLQAQTGLTNKEMKKFDKAMKELYKNNYGESLEDIGDKMAYIKQVTGETDPSKIKELTENAIALEDTFGSDFKETVRGVTNLMNHFGIDSKTAFDLFAKGSQLGLDYTDELGDNVAEYGGNFKQAGYSAQEYFQLLVNGSKSGAYNLDKVNDSINEVKNRLGDGTIEKNLSSFSKETKIAFKNWKSGKGTMKDVIDSIVGDINNCTNEQKALTLAQVAFGTMGEDANLKVVKSLTSVGNSFEDVNGSMSKVKDIRYDDVGNQFKKLGRTLQTDLILPIGSKLLPQLQDFTKKYTPEIKRSLSWVIKNLPTIAKTVGTIGIAYGTYKTAVKGATAALTIQAAAQTLLKKKTVEQTAATVGATVAQKALNTAQKANAFGLAASGVALLITGIVKLAKVTNSSTKETDKETVATQKLMEKQKELNKELKESEKARKKNIDDSQEQTSTADVLFKKLQELEEIENKSNSQKETMARLVSELNTIMPDLNLQYDKEKDKLNLSTEAIKENIDAQQELMLAKAQQENLIKIAEQISSIEMQNKDLTEQKTKNEKAYKKAKEELADFEKKHGTDIINMTDEELAKYGELRGALASKRSDLNGTKEALKENKTELEGLNKEYKSTSEYIEDNFNKAEIKQALSKLVEQAKTEGIEIPKAVKTGIEEGRYAIPEGMEQLQTLINFDKALQKAGLDGKKIPQYISDGVMNGKISVDEAIKQINDVLTVSDKAKAMYDSGSTISKKLADGIKSGKVSIDEANKIIEQSIKLDGMLKEADEKGRAVPEKLAKNVRDGKITVDEAIATINTCADFNKMKEEATGSGKKVAENLATQIKNGKVKPQQAIDEMNALTNFNELTKKADEAGIKVPDSITKGIESGKIKPSKAVNRMNSLISYRDALDKAGLEGTKIPESFSKSILSGETKVKDANKYINNLISFKEANQKSIDSGYTIPETLKNGILSGSVSVKKANEQMNRWIEFQKAHDKSKLSGKKIPKNIEEGILNGKYSVKQAMAILNSDMDAEMDKQPPKAKSKAEKTGDEYAWGFESKRPLIVGKTDSIASQAVGNFDKKETAKSKAEKNADGATEGLENKRGLVVGKIDSIASEAAGAFNKSSEAYTATGYLIGGAKNRADEENNNKNGGFLGSVASLANKAITMIKSIWDEHSPSKVSYSLSDYFVQGLTNGVNDNAKYFDKSVQNMALSAVKTLNNSSSTFKDIGKTNASNYALGLGSVKHGLTVNGIDNGAFSQVKQSLASSSGSISNSISPINSNASNSIKSGDVVNNYNFYQTNNSPKALSQLEIYRQTHNLLTMPKGGK